MRCYRVVTLRPSGYFIVLIWPVEQFECETLALVNSMKIEILFAGLNLNMIIQKKTPEKWTFYG